MGILHFDVLKCFFEVMKENKYLLNRCSYFCYCGEEKKINLVTYINQ